MARRIALISCSAEKASSVNPLPARSLYRSQLFRKSVAWVEQQGLEWFVLSAAYGLIRPADQLMPYDKSAASMSAQERSTWDRVVAQQIDVYTSDDDAVELVLLAGEKYAGWISMVAGWARVEQPLARMQIGQRLQWLTNELREGQGELFA